MVCLTVLFFNNQEISTVLLSKLSWSAFRWDKILVFHTRRRVFSVMERVRSKNLYTNSFTRNELWNFRLMALKTSALYMRFYLNPVKVQCYRITYVHNYYSVPSTTVLWKILYLIFFDLLNQVLWGILFGSSSRVNWDKLTVIEMVQDIESVSQCDWFICHIFESAGLKLSRYKYFWLVYLAGLKTPKGLA